MPNDQIIECRWQLREVFHDLSHLWMEEVRGAAAVGQEIGKQDHFRCLCFIFEFEEEWVVGEVGKSDEAMLGDGQQNSA